MTGVARGGVGRGDAAEKVRWWDRNVVGVVLALRGRRRRVRLKELRRAFILNLEDSAGWSVGGVTGWIGNWWGRKKKNIEKK